MSTSIRSAITLLLATAAFLLGELPNSFGQAKPSITTQPQSQSVVAGANVSFSVVASGQTPLDYQWYFNGNAVTNSARISGSTTATLSISGVQTNDAGGYSVAVGNRHGLAGSSTATLIVLVPVAITSQPTNRTIVSGTNITFTVTAEGTLPIGYQWFRDGSPLADDGRVTGSHTAALTISNVTASDAGSFHVDVSNSVSSAGSSNALLVILSAPSDAPYITSFSPVSGKVGTTVTLSGMNFSPVSSNNIVYFGAVRANVVSASAYSIDVIVPMGATYAPITVTVNGLTGYANAAFAPTFIGNGQPVSPSTFAPGQNGAAGTHAFLTVSSDLDGDGKPDLAVLNYTARTVSLYRNISTNGLLTAGSFTRADLPAVSSPSGLYGFSSADLDGDGKVDLIFTDPANNRVGVYRNVATTGSLTTNSFAAPVYFSVGVGPEFVRARDIDGDGKVDVATGNSANTVSILRNVGVPGSISFAPKVDLATGGGAHDVVIQDLDGDGKPDLTIAHVDASVISLFRNVSAPGGITPDSFAPRVDLGAVANHFTVVAGDVDGDGKPDLLAGGKGSTLSVYRNIASPGSLTTDSFAARVDFGNPGWVHNIALSDINGDGKPDINVVGELQSYMAVYQNQSTPGSFTEGSLAPRVDFATGWNAWGISVGDLDGDERPDTVFCNQYDHTFTIYRNVTPFGGPPFIISQPMEMTVPVSSNVVISAIVGGQVPLDYRWLFNGTNLAEGGRVSGAQTSSLNIASAQTNDNGSYQLVVSNALGVVTSAVATLNVTIVPPAIIQQPQSQNLTLGSNAVFSVGVTGTDPLAYQWFFNNTPLVDGQRVTGATNAALVINNVSTNDTGDYFVVITNQAGSITSSVATMGMFPSITMQPVGQTNLLGANATFAVLAEGTAPLNYQWRFNGANLSDNARISGATNSTLTISNLVAGDAGSYDVIVINPVGSVTSVVATLTILQPPTFTTQPVGRSVVPTLPTTFNALATSSYPISYQWQLNGANVSDATNTSYAIPAVRTNDFGSYQLVASNELGFATSAAAELTFGSVVAWGRNSSGESLPPPGLSNVFAVAGSASSSIAVRSDGSLVAWGSGPGTNVPTGLTNVVAISSSGGTVALRADGSIIGWNFGTVAVIQVPPLTNITAVAAGFSHGLALRSDGQVLSWGNSPASTVPVDLFGVRKIACGVNHSLALRSDGTVVSWGNFGSATNVPSGLKEVVAIAGGYSHSLALKSDGTVVAWGTGSGTNLPPGLTNVVSIAAGGYPQGQAVSLAIRANGSVVSWGDNGFGETNTPAALSNLVSVAVAGAPYHSLAIVGDGKPLLIEQPVGGTSWTKRDFAMHAKAVGNAPLKYQWRFNGVDIPGATSDLISLTNLSITNAGSYQLVVSNVIGVTASIPVPLTVMSNVPPTLLSQPPSIQTNYLGNVASLGVTVAGSGPITYQWRMSAAVGGPSTNIPGATNATLVFDPVLMWHGSNYFVQVTSSFGSTSTRGTLLRVQPVRVWGYQPIEPPSTLSNVVSVAVGHSHYLALRSDGKISGWGTGFSGETNPPASLTNAIVTAIAAGNQHSLALRSDGIPVAWGYASFGVTNVPASAKNVIAISAGRDHDLALRSDGTVVAWGSNSFGQTNVPVSATNVVGIAAGGNHSLALRSNGTIVGWGNNTYGQISPPINATNIIAIAAGGDHSLALKADGTVVAWGNSRQISAVTNVPSGLSNVVAISASGGHNTALRSDGTIVTWGSYLYYNTSGNITPQGDFGSIIQIADGGDRSVCLFGTRVPVITIQPFSRIVFKGSNTVLNAKASAAQPASYQWVFNGANISGATNDSLVLTNMQFAQSGAYQLVVSNRYGITASKPTKVVVSIPLAQALDYESTTWTSSGASAWFGQTNTTHDHFDAARSGAIDDGQETVLQANLKTGPGQISFWWKVSSETGFDKLEFLVNGVVQATISGEVDWQQRIIPIPVGSPLLQWRYSKDASGSIGQDAAWVDQISLVPNPPVITVQPVSKTVDMGTNVTFSVGVSGTGPFGFKWRKDETNIVGFSSSVLNLNNVRRTQRGVYSVIVTNAGGSVTSSNAILNVLVPQQLSAPVLLPDGTFQISSTDADGGLLSAEDLANLELQASADLTNWIVLPNGLSLTNGTLLLNDTQQTNLPTRFYRVIEH